VSGRVCEGGVQVVAVREEWRGRCSHAPPHDSYAQRAVCVYTLQCVQETLEALDTLLPSSRLALLVFVEFTT
jgi:hypothetical protein